MKTRVVPTTFYLGISLLILAALFKIQHWPGSLFLYPIGVSLEFICFVVLTIEIFSSKKAKVTTKLLWGLPAVIVTLFMGLALAGLYATALPIMLPVFVLGAMYNRNGRKKFLNIRGKHDHISFDSIDV